MSTKLGVIVADFRTSLAVKMAVGATTGTLQSATDDDGVALPAGNYYMTIDGDNSQKEHIRCTLAGTALSSVKSVSRQGVQTVGAVREHRIGASVTITNFAHLKEINNLISGATDLDSSDPLKYDGVASLTPGSNELATVAYADALAIAGAPDANTTQKGISEQATNAETKAGTATGGTAAKLFATPADIADAIQSSSWNYAADAQASDTYVITLVPAITAYASGQSFKFKANTANTGAATLNVNGLGAVTIKKFHDQDLETGDIEAGQIVDVVYDGTNFELQSPVASQLTTAIATETTSFFSATDITGAEAETLSSGVTSSADTLHTHNLYNLYNQTFGVGRMTYNLLDLCDRTATSGFSESVFTACTITEYPLVQLFITPASSGQGGKVATSNVASNTLSNMWTLNNSMIFEALLTSNTSQDCFMGIGGSVTIAGANGASVSKHIGFFVEDGTIWASNADGTTQTRTDVSAGITLTNANTFSWEFTSGTNIVFKINGTTVATHSTNLPATNSTDFEFVFGIATATNSAKGLQVFRRVQFLMKQV